MEILHSVLPHKTYVILRFTGILILIKTFHKERMNEIERKQKKMIFRTEYSNSAFYSTFFFVVVT